MTTREELNPHILGAALSNDEGEYIRWQAFSYNTKQTAFNEIQELKKKVYRVSHRELIKLLSYVMQDSYFFVLSA